MSSAVRRENERLKLALQTLEADYEGDIPLFLRNHPDSYSKWVLESHWQRYTLAEKNGVPYPDPKLVTPPEVYWDIISQRLPSKDVGRIRNLTPPGGGMTPDDRKKGRLDLSDSKYLQFSTPEFTLREFKDVIVTLYAYDMSFPETAMSFNLNPTVVIEYFIRHRKIALDTGSCFPADAEKELPLNWLEKCKAITAEDIARGIAVQLGVDYLSLDTSISAFKSLLVNGLIKSQEVVNAQLENATLQEALDVEERILAIMEKVGLISHAVFGETAMGSAALVHNSVRKGVSAPTLEVIKRKLERG